MPPLIMVPETPCYIATDRKYSFEHIWIKSVEADIVVFGISEPMVTILGEPYKMTFPNVGSNVAKDDSFSEIEGYKLTADLIMPVTGTVIQINTFLKTFSGGHVMEPVLNDPYKTGWMIAVKLTKPQEFNELMTPEAYMARVNELKKQF